MCIALIGGMDRLERHYKNEAEQAGVNLKVFSKPGPGLSSKLGNVDAVLIFTNKVSHRAKNVVMKAARSRDISVFMLHSCGICSFRDCLNCLKKKEMKNHSARN